MTKANTIVSVLFLFSTLAGSSFTKKDPSEIPVQVPKSTQRSGDARKGFRYITEGDFLKSGMPYDLFTFFSPGNTQNLLEREGDNSVLPYSFNAVSAPNGEKIVVPTCLQCHAQVFEGKLIVGLGNSQLDFSRIASSENAIARGGRQAMKILSPKTFAAAQQMFASFQAILPHMETNTRGVNAADRLAELLVAHRNKKSLAWTDSCLLPIADEVVPTDVPAWWLLKKKNAMFYTGFGRGDFGKFLMLSSLLTLKDTTEAREVDTHAGDVLAYIQSIEPPKYPKPIDSNLANTGRTVFIKNCSVCHGKYAPENDYPNLLIPYSIIKTDPKLFQSNQQQPWYIDWFNNSWYAEGPHKALLEPFDGYIAPPLDGVWATAPYLHNGSVPDLASLLDPAERPKVWKRSFRHPTYNYEKVGWEYTPIKKGHGNKKAYDTQQPGYGNMGHEFGTALTQKERREVLEYLKTL